MLTRLKVSMTMKGGNKGTIEVSKSRIPNGDRNEHGQEKKNVNFLVSMSVVGREAVFF